MVAKSCPPQTIVGSDSSHSPPGGGHQSNAQTWARGWMRRVGLTLIGCALVLGAVGILMTQSTSRHEGQFGIRRGEQLPPVAPVPTRTLPSCGTPYLSGWVTSVTPNDTGDTLTVARGDAIEVVGNTPYFSNSSITCDNGSVEEGGVSFSGGSSSSVGAEEVVAVREGSVSVVLTNGSAGPPVVVRIVVVGAPHTSQTGETVFIAIGSLLLVIGIVLALRRPRQNGGSDQRRADDAQRQGSCKFTGSN